MGFASRYKDIILVILHPKSLFTHCIYYIFLLIGLPASGASVNHKPEKQKVTA